MPWEWDVKKHAARVLAGEARTGALVIPVTVRLVDGMPVRIDLAGLVSAVGADMLAHYLTIDDRAIHDRDV